jgi:hypothetical protein
MCVVDFHRYTANITKYQADYTYIEKIHAHRFQLAVMTLFGPLETCITILRPSYRTHAYLIRIRLYSYRFAIASRKIAAGLLRHEDVQRMDAS